ncbi:unnamed protein product [Calypogeia fissa]
MDIPANNRACRTPLLSVSTKDQTRGNSSGYYGTKIPIEVTSLFLCFSPRASFGLWTTGNRPPAVSVNRSGRPSLPPSVVRPANKQSRNRGSKVISRSASKQQSRDDAYRPQMVVLSQVGATLLHSARMCM